MENELQNSLHRLRSLDIAKRDSAVQELVALGEPAVAPLLRWMQHSTACLPAELVNFMSYPEVVNLVQAIHNSVDEALMQIGEPAVAPLIEIFTAQGTPAKLRERAGLLLQRIGEPAVQPLSALLQHDSLQVRAAAASALSGVEDVQAANALRATLRDAVQSMRHHRRRSAWRVPCFYTAYGLLITTDYVWLHKGAMPTAVGSMINIVFVASRQLFIRADKIDKLRRNAFNALLEKAKSPTIGLFAACLEDSDRSVRKAAREALVKLLPRVQASDRQYISPPEMDILLKHLSGKDQRFTLAILKALEQIGDDKALPKVEAIAANGFNAEEVVQAARGCLPFLRQRADATRQASTLLRASEPDRSPDTLLRAAQGSAPVPAEQLLRPKL